MAKPMKTTKRNTAEESCYGKRFDKVMQKFLPAPGLPYTDKMLEKMDIEELKWLTVELQMLYRGGRISFEKQDLLLKREYGCKTYGEVNNLLKRDSLIYHRKTRRPICRVIVTRDKNNRIKTHNVFMGYRYISMEEILKDAITPKNTP